MPAESKYNPAHEAEMAEAEAMNKPMTEAAKLKRKAADLERGAFAAGAGARDAHVAERLRAGGEIPEKIKTKEQAERSAEYLEMKKLFGERFKGFEERQEAYTLKDGTMLIELTAEEQKEAEKELAEFLKESDVAEFIDRAKDGRDTDCDLDEFCLEYSTDRLTGQKPLTMEAMQARVAPDMLAQDQGKLLYNVDWYPTEKFYTKEKPRRGWVLRTNELICRDKNFDTETAELKKFGKKTGLKFSETDTRSRPVEILDSEFVAKRTSGKGNLEDCYERTATPSSHGSLVGVGNSYRNGALVHGWHPKDALPHVGARFSRWSGQK